MLWSRYLRFFTRHFNTNVLVHLIFRIRMTDVFYLEKMLLGDFHWMSHGLLFFKQYWCFSTTPRLIAYPVAHEGICLSVYLPCEIDLMTLESDSWYLEKVRLSYPFVKVGGSPYIVNARVAILEDYFFWNLWCDLNECFVNYEDLLGYRFMTLLLTNDIYLITVELPYFALP